MGSDSIFHKEYILKKFLGLFNSQLFERCSENEKLEIYNILSRKEEVECSHKDSFGNFEFSFSETDYTKPYLDYFVISLLNKYGLKKLNIWGDKSFGLLLTHDVDLVNKNHFVQDFRASLKYFFHSTGLAKLKGFIHFALIFRNILFRIINGKDTLWDYNKWTDIEQKYNFTSTYFFFIRPSFKDLHQFDCDFHLKDKFKFNSLFIDSIQYIKFLNQSGFEIGLHGSYKAALNRDLINQQVQRLSSVLDLNISCYRNHYLHFDINLTPLEMSNTSIDIDSTLGFNRDIGFRAGTSFPFYFYTSEMNKPILEVPQIIMDSSLFLTNSLELDLNLAKRKVNKIIDQVESLNGLLTINFHPDKISKPYYFNLYEHILQECQKRNALSTSFKQLKNMLS